MTTIAAAIIQQKIPRPIKPQTIKPMVEVGEAVVLPLAAVSPNSRKASSAMRARMKETRPATKSNFATAPQLYHGRIRNGKV